MAKTDSKTTDVAVKEQNTAMAEYGAYADYAGAGFENQTSDDYSIPFLQILQALSPQLQENDSLRQGMILNTVTGEVWDGKKGIAFVPATTQHVYVEWKPRDAGGGFVGIHEVNSDLVNHAKAASAEYGKYSTPDGNELIETFYVYGIALDDDGNASEAVLAFSSTKIKKYKGWMTKAKTIQIPLPDGRRIPAPLFAHRYRLKTVSEKNNKGQFFNWDAIAFDGENAQQARLLPDDPLFQSAVNIKSMIEQGKARAAYESQAPGSADEEAQGAGGGKPVF
ncbi:hypothetical protein PAE1_36 [Pseudomonas phage PAE1]|uniref:ATP-binding protein n=3 Tax=root TaxID=1 RepID=A0A1B0Z027_9CAUD|nr:hypothetical protein ORF044 [Pseudomonas phage M6]YP_009215727.1 hypothetical protein PAE1_36 [Pseudomonas phage PAE1]ANO57400.1 ATP-binding protein [Pseudomonas phage AN14]QAX99393.1 hypothetical protein PaSz4_13 [Pseudomonas phage PaSz-4]WNV49158.1 hypothetical protein [Pseudomonas phage Chuck]ALF51536.1 hypothetical protein PAE1_36 [Pseudomonas phage PAE1]